MRQALAPRPAETSRSPVLEAAAPSPVRAMGYAEGARAMAPKPNAGAAPEPTWTPAPTLAEVAAGAKLAFGCEGESVRELQALLKAPETGRFDAHTRDAVREFQLVAGLSETGVVGPTMLKRLRQKGAITGKAAHLRASIVETARGEVGTREDGKNGGAALEYQRYFKRGPEEWCADFVSWVYTHAGQKMNQSSVTQIVRQLKAARRWKTSGPVPGDMVIFDWDGDGLGDHIGIVEGLGKNGVVKTIEGNTPHPTSRKQGVWEKDRARSQILGYGRP